MKAIFIPIFFIFTCFSLVLTASADSVYMTSGEVMKGLVVEEHYDRIVFSTYRGEIQIPKFSIEQIFFDNEEQNYTYLGDKALSEGDFDRALGFYQKAYQINPDYERVKWAFLRLVDSRNRVKIGIQPQALPSVLDKQFGIAIEKAGDRIKIASVTGSAQARGSGITEGDFIVNVWDASTMYMEASLVSELMVGLPNTPVRLVIEKNIILPVKPIPWFKKIFYITQFIDFGFNLSLRPTGLFVVYIRSEGAAEKHGLQIMDEITHINGESTRYMPASLVRKRIFQSNLKQVTLTVRRQLILTRNP